MEVKDLRVRFKTKEGTVYAVNGVSYTLREGETLGVVGESGSGKVSMRSLLWGCCRALLQSSKEV